MPAPRELADRTERLRSRLKWFLFSRVLVASFFLGALALLYLGSGGERYTYSVQLLLSAIVAVYALTIVSAVFLLRLQRLLVFTYLQMGFDIALTTGVILVTGGADSPFGFLYSLVVINSAILLSTPGAIGAASTSSIAYAVLVALLNGGAIPRPDYPFRPAPPDVQFALRFATTNATFYLIAILAGILVRRLHHTERLLRERESERDRLASLHDALAGNIGSALVTTDVNGSVTSMNQIAEELIGAKAVQVLGADVGTVFAPLRNTAVGRQQFLQSSSGGQPTEFTHRTQDGRELIVRCSAVPLRDTYHHPIGALYILQDVTALQPIELEVSEDHLDASNPEPGDEDAPATDGLIGNSPEFRRIRAFIAKIADTDATVLITGESGTGKELVARAVHARSGRGERPFVAVNCGAIPENLIESELFGHVKGAFTGAVATRAGLFRMADGGTIFLDEIAELPLALQVKLLRVLQERSFTPIGSDTHVTVDVRIIAATNRRLDEERRAGRFREDLFYRLNVLTMELPPLRQRRQDIAPLVRHFLREFSDLRGKHVQRFSVAAARRLHDYDYPGNVRELENVVEHAVALCDDDTVHEANLPEYVLKVSRTTDTSPAPILPPPVLPLPTAQVSLGTDNLDDNLAAYEKGILLRALAEAGGVKKRAAELLGINYRSFRHRLQKYGLGDSAPAASNGEPDDSYSYATSRSAAAGHKDRSAE